MAAADAKRFSHERHIVFAYIPARMRTFVFLPCLPSCPRCRAAAAQDAMLMPARSMFCCAIICRRCCYARLIMSERVLLFLFAWQVSPACVDAGDVDS